MPLALYALTAGAFGIGVTEFVIMGLLLDVGADLGVSTSAAGFLISGYAIGVVVGAPLLTILTARWPRKTVLLALMGIFIAGNLACALAPTYGLLMAARVLTAFAHGTFFGVGSVVATRLVPADKKASAIALMFTGLTVANILGVPLGTWLGQTAGWRSTFWAVAAVGVAALAVIAWPARTPATSRARRSTSTAASPPDPSLFPTRQEFVMPSIGIIGAGQIGQAIATALARKSIPATLSNSRGPDSLKEIAAHIGPAITAGTREDAASKDIVFLAVNWSKLPGAVSGLPGFAGRIVVDANNPIEAPLFKPADLGGRLSTEIVADLVPSGRLVKAFNHLAPPLVAGDPQAEGGRRVLFYSGDDEAAKVEIAAIIQRLDFFGIDLGPLAVGGRLAQFPGGALPSHNLVRFD